MKERYQLDDKMHELLNSSEKILLVASRFNIPLGVGERTIGQICEENSVDSKTFLAVVNFTASAGEIRINEGEVDLKTLCSYLQNSHIYMIQFLLPHIRRHLIDALGSSKNTDITFLIIKFFDEYYQELKSHMEEEDKEIFSKINGLIEGKKTKKISVEVAKMHTFPIEQKLSELKNIIIKYYSSDSTGNNMVFNILQHLFLCEYDLYIHDRIENSLLLPEIKRFELRNEHIVQSEDSEQSEEENEETLTQREKDIIVGVVKGLTNKEIADNLFISVNTVTTHRRNIAKKLNIHSPSGLTIYAIVNNLVNIKDINL